MGSHKNYDLITKTQHPILHENLDGISDFVARKLRWVLVFKGFSFRDTGVEDKQMSISKYTLSLL